MNSKQNNNINKILWGINQMHNKQRSQNDKSEKRQPAQEKKKIVMEKDRSIVNLKIIKESAKAKVQSDRQEIRNTAMNKGRERQSRRKMLNVSLSAQKSVLSSSKSTKKINLVCVNHKKKKGSLPGGEKPLTRIRLYCKRQ